MARRERPQPSEFSDDVLDALIGNTTTPEDWDAF